MIIIILSILTLILSYIIYILYKRVKKLENNIVANYSVKTNKKLEEIEKEKEKREKECADVERRLEEQKLRADELNAQIDKRVEAQLQIEAERLKARLLEKEEEYRKELIDVTHGLLEEQEQIRIELTGIKSEVEDYKAKRQVINDEILRQRAIQEEQDFYRIVLTPDTIDDIDVIQSIREKLHKREYLDKMLYDNYVSKSVKEMCKRVLVGKDPSGIYKITNMKTQEIYVGKSVHVGSRWQEHIKTACGLEGVADSQFQRALKQYGIENWTFELLEEVSKDKLTEREKFYIDFFGTKEYGYNQRLG